jgi:DegV family protein with EDD domain
VTGDEVNAQVAVVTDSTAYLPPAVAARFDPAVTGVLLRTVPLTVVMGGRSWAEGVEVTSAQVAEALTARAMVTTSRPPPQVFVETYRSLAEAGCRQIVSIHLSSELSGTVDAARIAARTVAAEGIAVSVVDSRVLGMGLGFVVETAVAAAAQGKPRADVAAAAARRASGVRAWFYVDTLEFLRRGGRVSNTAAAVGSALAVKPVLELVEGRLELVDRVRTATRALARLQEITLAALHEELDAGHAVEVAVHHLAAPERAADLAAALSAALGPATGPAAPAPGPIQISEVGAVVGAHTGPGLVGAVLAPNLS